MSLFDWDEANIRHIAAHDVTPAEAEQALMLAPLELDRYVIDDELRFEDVGWTAAGRILKIVSVDRGEKVRVVTAYEPSNYLKRFYRRSMMEQ